MAKACRADQVRNSKTNRCNLIKRKSRAPRFLKVCRADQVRNPKTRRCNLVKRKPRKGAGRLPRWLSDSQFERLSRDGKEAYLARIQALSASQRAALFVREDKKHPGRKPKSVLREIYE